MHGNIPFDGVSQETQARRSCIGFLVDRRMLARHQAAAMLDIDEATLDAMLSGRGVILGRHGIAVMDRLMATMSLLLDGYGPDRMEKWFRTPMKGIGGKSPLQRLLDRRDGPDAVLAHAEGCMS